jgi:hypothetical protein
MKTPKLPALFFMLSCFNVSISHAVDHSAHGGSGGGSENTCLKPQFTKFYPANLATVAPGSEFSFMALNVKKPEQINVTVKTIPVALTIEDKDTFYLVKGHLPANLINTIARINIRVNSNISRCNGDNGWLLTISDQ